MILIWGRKARKDKLGWAADYCPFCRKPREMRVFRHRIVGHLYGVSLGRGTITGHTVRCTQCNNEWGTVPDQYDDLADKRINDLVELIGQTNPDLLDECEARMHDEELARTDPPHSDRRDRFISEAVRVIGPIIDLQTQQTQIDGHMAIALLGSVISGIVFGLTLMAYCDDYGPALDLIGASTAFGLFLAYFIWAAATSLGRFARRKVFPKLYQLIGFLEPRPDELAKSIDDGVGLSKKARKVLDPQRLRGYMENPKAADRPSVA